WGVPIAVSRHLRGKISTPPARREPNPTDRLTGNALDARVDIQIVDAGQALDLKRRAQFLRCEIRERSSVFVFANREIPSVFVGSSLREDPSGPHGREGTSHRKLRLH